MAAQGPSSPPSRGVWGLVGLGIIRTFSVALVTPYIGLILLKEGMPVATVGVYYVVLGAAGAAGQLSGGFASDAMGRKASMVLGLAAAGAALAFMGYAVGMEELWPLAAGAAVQSYFGSFSFSALNTMVGDYGGGMGQMVRNYGLVRIGINLGWALGPLVGGFLMDAVGYSWAFYASGAAVAASSLAVLPVKAAIRYGRPGLPDRVYLTRMSPFFLLYMFIAQFGLTLTVFENVVRGLTLAEVGSLYTVNGLVVVALQYPISRRASMGDPIRWLEGGVAMYAIGFLMLGLWSGLPWAMASVAMLTVGEDMVSPIASAIANALADPRRRGSYLGAFGVLTGFSRSLGSSYGGLSMSYMLYDPVALWASVDVLGIASAAAIAAVVAPTIRGRGRPADAGR